MRLTFPEFTGVGYPAQDIADNKLDRARAPTIKMTLCFGSQFNPVKLDNRGFKASLNSSFKGTFREETFTNISNFNGFNRSTPENFVNGLIQNASSESRKRKRGESDLD